jgi:hypothetical protein
MKNKMFIFGLIFGVALIIGGCSKDSEQGSDLSHLKKATQGAIHLSGAGYFDAIDACNTAEQGADYTLTLTGDLVGCLFTFVDNYDCTPGGTYMELGREYFVGTYKGVYGTFWTEYRFEAKYEGCAEDGSYLGAEIKGRCQHPITEGMGTGVFEGVTGRLDFKDVIEGEAITYVYRGHLKF